TLHRTLLAEFGHDVPCVEAVERGHARFGEPLRHVVGEFAGEHRGRLDVLGLEALVTNPVVPDERVREREHLLGVRWIGETLLVARVRRREHQFATTGARRARTSGQYDVTLDGDVGLFHYDMRTDAPLITVVFETKLRYS